MPIITNEAPPDGFYWFASANPSDDPAPTIVKVERTVPWSSDAEPDVQVWFIGSDVEQEWSSLHGLFMPVAPPLDFQR